MTYDDWKTAPLECAHCGGSHSRRYCAALHEEEAEAAEMKADEKRDDAYFKKMGWD